MVTYLGGVKSKKKINTKTAYQKHKIFRSYVAKEWKMLLKNPIFFMQCVLPSILFPIIFGAGFFVNSSSSGEGSIAELVQDILPMLYTPTALCVILLILEFLMAFSFVAVTAFSRDGNYAIFTKYIPIPFYQQVLYKVAPAIMINNFPILFLLILLGVFLKASPLYLILIFILANILNLLNSYIGIIVDLKRPKLEWNTEYAVVKQNMNMLFTFAFAFGVIFLFLLLALVSNLISLPIMVLTLFVLLGGSTFALDRYLYHYSSHLFQKIC